MLYPLTFYPVYKNYLWGGRNFEKLGRTIPPGTIAESWEVSCHPDGTSIIANGHYRGMLLPEYLQLMGKTVLGTALPPQYQIDFPLLIKLIDAHQKLSIQVHPDDEYARKFEHGSGKNEMWYIIDAEPGASVIYDLHSGIDREKFTKSIQNDEVESCLQSIKVKAGDVLDIPAGIMHGLGAGILLAEIQQSSNLTYRIYDYHRTDSAGVERPLHLDKALDVINFNSDKRVTIAKGQFESLNVGVQKKNLVENVYFSVQLFNVDGSWNEEAKGDRFVIYTFLKGTGTIEYRDQVLPIITPQSILIPAALGQYLITGTLEYLKIFIQ